MEQFKKKHFLCDNPGASFPFYTVVDQNSSKVLLDHIRQHFSIDPSYDELGVLKKLWELGTVLRGVRADRTTFCLEKIVAERNLTSTGHEVYVNWFRFDALDKMLLVDLSSNFTDIWYPSADDIEIFDDTTSWVLSIRHDGVVSLALAASLDSETFHLNNK